MLPQAFISHNRADNPWCEKLHIDLCKRLHLSKNSELIYLDRRMAPGTAWKDHLWSMLNQSKVFLIVVSPDAARSAWVRDEVMRALELKKIDASRIIIPVLLPRADMNDLHEIHGDLASFQFADFRDPTRYQEVLYQLAYTMSHPDKVRGGGVGPIPDEPILLRAGRWVKRIYLGG